MASIRTGLADPGVSPVEATLRILTDELAGMTSALDVMPDPAQAITMFQRVGTLMQSTPSLRAHQSDVLDQLIAVAADVLAERAGVSPQDPEPQIAAIALLGLW